MEFAVLAPELLLEVFSNAEQEDLAAAARVCQKWSTSALDVLWRDLDSVVPLVELVVPLVPTDNNEWSFSLADKPTASQWNRYDSYAGRVRTIMFDDQSYVRDGQNTAITVELIKSLVDLHPRGAFCPPKLWKMDWTSSDAKSALGMVPFLRDTIEDLSVYLYVGVETERELVEQAIGRTPHLRSLRLGLADGLESSLALWLSKSPLLESFSLLTDHQATSIVEALGDLANLTRLKLRYETDSEEGTTDRCFLFNSPHSFPRLETLEIEASLDQLVGSFQTSERFAQLKQVVLILNSPTPKEVFNLTTAVSQLCPGIAAITMNIAGFCKISFQHHIRPLLACHSLKAFEIKTTNPFSTTEQDLRDMALAWPGIQELNLSSESSAGEGRGGFPLRLLPIAAGLFPTLQILRIYLDPKGAALEFDYKIIPSSEFQSLQVLDVGSSSFPRNDPIALGFIIGALCKLEIQIVGGFNRRTGRPSETTYSSVMGYSHTTKWSNVQDVVAMLVKSKRAIHKDWNIMPKPQTAGF